MKQPTQCPAGTWYDAALHPECPCPNCWADRSFVRLSAAPQNAEASAGAVEEKNAPSSAASSNRGDFRTRLARLDGLLRTLGSSLSAFKTDSAVAMSPSDAAFLFGCLAVVSAVLTAHWSDPWPALRFGFHSGDAKAPLLPGLYFGLIVCSALYVLERPAKKLLLGALVLTVFAWILAWDSTITVGDALNSALLPPGPDQNGLFREISPIGRLLKDGVSGLAGGFVGSLVTVCGVSLASVDFRRRRTWLRTLLIGTLTGVLFVEFTIAPVLNALFLVWQPAVAGSIAYGLAEPKWSRVSLQRTPRQTWLPIGPWKPRHTAALCVAMLAIVVHCVAALYTELESKDEQMFSNAGSDVTALQQYLTHCKLCRYRAQALATIGAAPESPSTDQEESNYRTAKGNVDRLSSYLTNCRVCAFASAAREEVSYLNATGDIDGLRAYVRDCKVCEFSSVAQQQIRDLQLKGKTFDFEVCNNTSYQAAIAVAAREDPDFSVLTVRGWGLVDPGACKTLGRFVRGDFYVAARVNNQSKGWPAGDAKYCVETPGPFEHLLSPDYTCPPGATMLGFKKLNAITEKFSWALPGEPSFSDTALFSFEVCNPTAQDASVAIAGRDSPDSPWMVAGWWSVHPGACDTLGRYARGKFYAAARVAGAEKGWYGSDLHQCVEFPGPFNRPDSSDSSCPTNGKIIGFQGFDVTADKITWALPGDPSFGDSAFFDFEVCNRTSLQASVATMGRADPDAPFVVQGWQTVPAGACAPIGKFARGTFYAMASVYGNITRGWWTKDVQLCVELPGPFHRVNSDGYSCRRDERLVPFRKFSVTESKLSWSLTEATHGE